MSNFAAAMGPHLVVPQLALLVVARDPLLLVAKAAAEEQNFVFAQALGRSFSL